MQIFPTIHIKNGRCFSPSARRSAEGHNIYTSHPAKLAAIWEEAGASWLHVIDVDGATIGYPANEETVREILDTVHIPVQFGGGLRTVKDIDHMIQLGVSRVVCGTKPVENHRFAKEAVELFGADKFAVGIDTLNGMIAIEGREKMCDFNVVSLAHKLKEAGVETMIYTDVTRSSMHQGQDIENLRDLIARTDMDIIVSGGIYRMSDLYDVSQLHVKGAIIASALYEGKIDLKEAISQFQ